jgi:hypothetical protein
MGRVDVLVANEGGVGATRHLTVRSRPPLRPRAATNIADRVGAAGPCSQRGFFISNEYPTFDCINDVARVEFVSAYFKAPHIWQEVAVGSKGLGNRRQRVEPEQILKHVVWLPPMEWQDQIAAVMAQVERLAEEQSETAGKMDALVPAVLDQAVRGRL